MNNLVQAVQSRVVAIHENVDYSTIVMQSYPNNAIQREPFIGFKVLLKDMNANSINPAGRLAQIDSIIAQTNFIYGTGCFLRETDISMPDGLWLVTFPVPRSHLKIQYENMMRVADFLQRNLGIYRVGMYEINVSGRADNTELALNSLDIPDTFMTNNFVRPKNSPYVYGNVIRINNGFMLLRTRWMFDPNKEAAIFDMQPKPGTYKLKDSIMTLCQLIASIYH